MSIEVRQQSVQIDKPPPTPHPPSSSPPSPPLVTRNEPDSLSSTITVLLVNPSFEEEGRKDYAIERKEKEKEVIEVLVVVIVVIVVVIVVVEAFSQRGETERQTDELRSSHV
ncbi:hypothetical protein HZH68_005756 [Vespula germanica]|uniref:Uncharacterized protein n=1 Tax=Vespula germanica TaxID=30212 RepID=A0A834KGZ5_VESGE|nr:hypothetical protein HZH68_005756 [Vespula germanica]